MNNPNHDAQAPHCPVCGQRMIWGREDGHGKSERDWRCMIVHEQKEHGVNDGP